MMKNEYRHHNNGTTSIYYFSNLYGKKFETIIDTKDFEKANSLKNIWFITNNGNGTHFRVKGKVDGKNVYLYRFILGLKDENLVVDHIDGDTLNNTRDNLRTVTPLANSHNKHNGWGTLPRNVTYIKRDNKYRVTMLIKGKRKSFGQYFTVEEAEKAAIEARREYMPDCLN